MKYMTDALGMPSKSLILRGTRKEVFFDDESNHLKPEIISLASTLEMFSKPLNQRI
jgi:hypothetical protein